MLLLAADDPLSHVTDVVLTGDKAHPVLTMHTVTIVIVAVIFVLVMMRVSRRIATGPETEGNDRYLTKGRLAQVIETMIVYLRDEMLTPVLGPKATRTYLPFLMTVFFFILFNNLFGLVPLLDLQHLIGEITGNHFTTWFGGTATGNIAVTAALALVAGIVIQIHAFKELGIGGWLEHHCGGLWPMPNPLFFPVVLLVFIVEVAGDFIKPAALAIRLFANMLAGHVLLAVLLAFGKMAAVGGMGVVGVTGISLVSGVAAVLITFLEVFVAFLQAFIFMFLTAVFISLMSHHEHDEEEHAHNDLEHDLDEALHHDTAKA